MVTRASSRLTSSCPRRFYSSIQDGVANQFRSGVCAAPEIAVLDAATEGHTHA